MKFFHTLLMMLCAIVLIACSNDSELNTGDSTAENGNTEQLNQNESTDSIEQVIAAAKELAGESTAHEGRMEVHERMDEGESPIDEQMIESTYKQNEMVGGEGEGHQLQYDKKTSNSSGSIETAFYLQPEMASYSYYGPDNSWHATDYSEVNESIEERLDYMSPYDALQLYEEFKDGAEVMEFDDGTFTVTLYVDLEQAIDRQLEFQYLEPESFYYSSAYFFDLKEIKVMLTFDKGDEMLTGIFVEGLYEDMDNEMVTLRIQGRQMFDSYMLTDEIRPPDEAFTSSGLNKWDY